jgi:hypothetical protein
VSRPAPSPRALVALFALPPGAAALAFASLSACLAGVALLAGPSPAHAQWGCPARRGTHISIHETNERRTLLIADDRRCLEVRSVGAVTFSDDDADVAALAPGGMLSVEETRDGRTRRAEFVERGGRVERRYLEDGRVREGADGADWLRTILPQVARESSVGAEARVARLLRQRGPQGVLDEVRLIASDGVKRTYLSALLAEPRLGDDVLRDVVRATAARLTSDSDRRRLLVAVAERPDASAALLTAVVEAARALVSDSDKARVLAAALAARNADAATRATAVTVSRSIVSDRAKGELLAALAPAAGASESARAEWLRGAGSIVSDTERRRVLLAALDAPAHADALLGSDAGRGALFDVVDGIASDREKGAVLRAVLRRERLPQPALLGALRAAERIASDREKAEVLLAVAARREALEDERVRRAFLDVTRGISSSGEYRRVMDAVVR